MKLSEKIKRAYECSKSPIGINISDSTLLQWAYDAEKLESKIDDSQKSSDIDVIIESRLPEGFIEAPKRAMTFKHDLKILLQKHRATIECEAEPHYEYTPNQDDIVVELEYIYNDEKDDVIAEAATVNLGRYVDSDSL